MGRHGEEEPGAARRGDDDPDRRLDDLAEQLERFRLLPGGSDAEAERVLAGLTPSSPREEEAARELLDRRILAQPARFEEAHRRAVKALEVYDRHGWRAPALPAWLGPARPVARRAVELVTRYIVRSHAGDVGRQMRRLYARREAQCAPDAPERRPLARARIAMSRVEPDLGGGQAGLPRFLVGGAAVSGLASLGRQLGDLDGRVAIAIPAVTAFAVFAAVSWVLVRGAAVAHRRTALILRAPLVELWDAVGNCGRPPQDDSTTIAAVGIVITAVGWFVVPFVVALLFYFL